MSLEYIVARIKAGLWTFSRLVFNANRDLPFHDYHLFTLGATGGWLAYAVGADNITDRGSQKKLFTSKSTLIYSTLNIDIKFNSMNNVPIAILNSVWYEFKSNIFQVFANDSGEDVGYLKLYFEGVMSDEARRPE
jgi:hypothetical protein